MNYNYMNYKYKYLKYKNKYLKTKKKITRGGSSNNTSADNDDFSDIKSPEGTWQTKEREKNIIKINYRINLEDYHIYIDRTSKIEKLKEIIISNRMKDIFRIKNLFKEANNENEILNSVNFKNLYTNLYTNIKIKHGEKILDDNNSIESTRIEDDAIIIIHNYYEEITLLLREIIHRIYMYNRSSGLVRSKVFYTDFPLFLTDNEDHFTDGEEIEYFIRKDKIMKILEIINLICKILYTLEYKEDFLYLKIKHIVEYYSPWTSIINLKDSSGLGLAGSPAGTAPEGNQTIAQFSQQYLDTKPEFKSFYMSLEVQETFRNRIVAEYDNMKQIFDNINPSSNVNNLTAKEIIRKFVEKQIPIINRKILIKIGNTILEKKDIHTKEDLLNQIFTFIQNRNYWFINEMGDDKKSEFRKHIINNYMKN